MSKKQTTYVIYRKGSNAANQPCEFGWVPVYVLEAGSRGEAEQAALEHVTCYANQILDARPASRVSRSDWQAACVAKSEADETDAHLDAIAADVQANYVSPDDAAFWGCGQ